VGAWCEKVAREPLTKRATLLAEIESSSGMVAIPTPPSERDAPMPPRIEGGGTVRVGRGELTSYAPSGGSSSFPPGPGRSPEGDGPVLASQPSTVSVAEPMPAGVPRVPMQRAILVAALGVGVLLLGGLGALVLGSRTAAAPTHAATTAQEASTPAPLPQESTSPAAPTASAAAAPPPPAPEVPPAPTANPEPAPSPPRHAVAAATHASPPTTPLAAPRPRSTCNPPYEIDSAGHRQYKPECL
jgi:hypothetical protein